MVPVKSTAAVLVASMSLFSAVPASAGSLEVGRKRSNTGTTPITGSSSGPVTSGPGGAPAPVSNGGNGGAPNTSGASTGSSSSGATGGASSIGSAASSGGPTGASPSPVTSGNRPTSGSNAPRPGPRAPVEQPNAGGTGPFTKSPEPVRTMDGSEGKGFNFGGMVSSLYQFTGTLMQLVMTFAMLKSVFGWFGKKDEKKSAVEAVKEVAASPDKGSNVARDASTKIDETLEAERARAEGRDGGNRGESEDAEASGMARK